MVPASHPLANSHTSHANDTRRQPWLERIRTDNRLYPFDSQDCDFRLWLESRRGEKSAVSVALLAWAT
jgi:hypothetical protein